MSRAVILQHSPNFGPGRIIPAFLDYGIPVDVRRLFDGDSLPSDLDEVRVLIVIGGDASVAAIKDQPEVQREIKLLQTMIAQDRATLGIGLGAHLLAHAAGAKTYPNAKPGAKPEDSTTPMPEYGWQTVVFPFPGGTEPIVYGMTDGVSMFHWHTDTLDLPKLPAPANPAPPPAPPPPTGNALLSSSRVTRSQAFRFKNRLLGFQYHFQLTNEDFEKIFANEREAITRHLGADGERTLRTETATHYSRYARLGDRLVQNFVQYLKAY